MLSCMGGVGIDIAEARVLPRLFSVRFSRRDLGANQAERAWVPRPIQW